MKSKGLNRFGFNPTIAQCPSRCCRWSNCGADTLVCRRDSSRRCAAHRAAPSPLYTVVHRHEQKGTDDSVPNRLIRLCVKRLLRTEPSVPFCPAARHLPGARCRDSKWIRYRTTTVLLNDNRGSEQYHSHKLIDGVAITTLGIAARETMNDGVFRNFPWPLTPPINHLTRFSTSARDSGRARRASPNGGWGE
jgi:hypothetical protein